MTNRKRKFLKGFAMFMAVEVLFNICIPTISYALTAGPSAPEFSSFEPVDTTDMVNMATGDFVYNMPLLEVPGPEGGYPLSLSYHAGIKPAQEASWVGLGWTLNPGAINRVVNGASDDSFNSQQVVSDYWDGGSATSTARNIGLSIGNTGVGVNYGWVTTRDSNKGFSSQSSFGISVNPVSAAISLASKNGTDKSQTGSSKESAKTNYTQNINGYGQNWLSAGTSLGVSISSKGTKFQASVAGRSLTTNNSGAGSVSSFTTSDLFGGFSFAIPVLGLGYDQKDYYTRYWSDQSASLNTFGALYAKDANAYINSDDHIDSEYQSGYVISYAYDNYKLYDATSNDLSDENDPMQQLGGSFPSFDQYAVLGQGVSGSIEPYIFETGDLHGQNYYEKWKYGGGTKIDVPILEYLATNTFDKGKADFRFKNDFSNSLKINSKTISDDGTDFSVLENEFELYDPNGFKDFGDNQHLAGSKNIEWYSTEEIADGTAGIQGLIDYYSGNSETRQESFELFENYLQPEAGVPVKSRFGDPDPAIGKAALSFGTFVGDTYEDIDPYEEGYLYRSLEPKTIDLSKKIGGFKITNETGITYHYSLPVYAYNEYTRIKTKNPHDGVVTFREERKEEPYAYTWLLTAVTGPDYVDRNLDGTLNDDDWGYWVKFDYGRWADSYQWRTPHTGYQQDIENNYETFSYGIKELYYLDEIETRTHKALFIKSKKKDGRGVTSRLEGGSKPRAYKMVVDVCDEEYLEYSVSPVSTMKLDEIFIIDKDEYNTLPIEKKTGSEYQNATTSTPHIYDTYNGSESVYSFNGTDIDANSYVKVKYHNGDLVLDKYDIEAIKDTDNGLVEKSLQVIQFNTDYSLAKGTPNSIGTMEDHLELYRIYGNGGQGMDITLEDCVTENPNISLSVLRETENPYVNPNSAQGACFATGFPICSPSMDMYSSDPLAAWSYTCDPLVHFCASDFYAKLPNYKGQEGNYHHPGKLTLNSIKILGRGGADIVPPTEFAYNKNPDYSKDAFDEWQYYKSDYDGTGYTRKRSEESADNVDAWSLNTITTPLGSTIDIAYESDDYSSSVINDKLFLSIKAISIDPPPYVAGSGKIKIEFEDRGIDLNDYFSLNDKIDPRFYLNIPSEDKVIGTVPYRLQNVLIRGNIEENLDFSMLSGKTTTLPMQIGHIGDYSVESINSGGGYIIVENEYVYNLISSASDVFFIHGYIEVGENIGLGGGLRVKTLAVNNSFFDKKYETRYDYTHPVSNMRTGVTAYTPNKAKTVRWSNEYLNYFDGLLEQYENVNIKNSIAIEYKKAIVKWSKKYYQDTKFGDILSLARDLPGPSVFYEYVTTRDYVNDVQLPGKRTDHFEVFRKDMVSYRSSYFTNSSTRQSRETVIENRTSSIGNFLGNEFFDDQNNLLSSTTMNYLRDANVTAGEEQVLETGQGTVEQSYHQNFVYKKYDDGATLFEEKNKAQISKRLEHVDVNTGVTTTNYKTGITNVSHSLAFDFYSGQVTKTLNSDGYGNHYVSEVTPAYHNYYGMGLAINGGANMLTQTAATTGYKVIDKTDLTPVGLVSASVQTWSDNSDVLLNVSEKYGKYYNLGIYSSNDDNIAVIDDLEGMFSVGNKFLFTYYNVNYIGLIFEEISAGSPKQYKAKINPNFSSNVVDYLNLEVRKEGVYRKKSFYSWIGDDDLRADGLFDYGRFTDFSTSSAMWQKNNEVTLYDVYSHTLEARDVNGNYAATKMDPKHELVIASVANASYDEMAYSSVEHVSAELYEEGEVNNGDGFISTIRAHTGDFSLQVAYGDEGFNYEMSKNNVDLDKKYFASVWVYLPGESETVENIAGAQLYYVTNLGKEVEVHPTIQKNKSKSWYLLEIEIDAEEAFAVTIGCRNNTSRSVYFDDFRVHPIDAAMTSYVYDQFSGELSYILDANNFYTHFEYDAIGRLVRTKRELLNFDFGEGKESFRADKILNERIYNYGKNHD